MIIQSTKAFFNNYTMKAARKVENIIIGKLQINIDGITYPQKSKFIYSFVRNASAMTLLNLKRYYIQFG